MEFPPNQSIETQRKDKTIGAKNLDRANTDWNHYIPKHLHFYKKIFNNPKQKNNTRDIYGKRVHLSTGGDI